VPEEVRRDGAEFDNQERVHARRLARPHLERHVLLLLHRGRPHRPRPGPLHRLPGPLPPLHITLLRPLLISSSLTLPSVPLCLCASVPLRLCAFPPPLRPFVPLSLPPSPMDPTLLTSLTPFGAAGLIAWLW